MRQAVHRKVVIESAVITGERTVINFVFPRVTRRYYERMQHGRKESRAWVFSPVGVSAAPPPWPSASRYSDDCTRGSRLALRRHSLMFFLPGSLHDIYPSLLIHLKTMIVYANLNSKWCRKFLRLLSSTKAYRIFEMWGSHEYTIAIPQWSYNIWTIIMESSIGTVQ